MTCDLLASKASCFTCIILIPAGDFYFPSIRVSGESIFPTLNSLQVLAGSLRLVSQAVSLARVRATDHPSDREKPEEDEERKEKDV